MPSPRVRLLRILWDGHAVMGVVSSLALFIMFYAGAFTLYRGELQAWIDPALRGDLDRTSPAVVDALLRRQPPDPGTDILVVHPFGDRPHYFVRYVHQGARVERRVGAVSGVERARDGRSVLPDLLHDLHYFRQLGFGGRTFSGVVSVLFVFVLVSGLILHLDKLPSALHDFRLGRGLRLAVTDAHTTLGVIGLPFSLMYAVTGAFLGLLLVVLSPTVLLVFDGDRTALEARLSGVEIPEPTLSGITSPPPAIAAVTRDLEARWGPGTRPFRTDVLAWGDAASLVVVEGEQTGSLGSSGKIVWRAATGEVVAETRPEDVNVLGRTVAIMSRLHFARLGASPFDGLFFVLALLSSAVILTGTVLWSFGRTCATLEAGHWKDRLLARSTIGVGLGLVLIIPVALLLSRHLPMEGPARRTLETVVFFLGWAASATPAFFARDPLRYGRHLLGGAAAASVGAALVDLLAADPLDASALAVDLGLLASGLAMVGLRRVVLPPLGRRHQAAGKEPSP